jgi:hypothetical protein
MANVDACTKKKFMSFFCGPNLCESRNFWEDSNGTAVPTRNGSLTRDIPSVGTLVGLLLLLCQCKLATIEQLMWPKPMTRLGLLLAQRQCGRARKLLLESTALQCQLRRESRFRVLEGHFPPSMISMKQWCYLGLGGPWKAPCSRALVELATLKKRSSRFHSNSSVGEGSCGVWIQNVLGQRPYLRCWALHAWERKEEVIWISDSWKLWDLVV